MKTKKFIPVAICMAISLGSCGEQSASDDAAIATPSCDSVAVFLFGNTNTSRSSAAITSSSGSGVTPKLDPALYIEQVVAVFELTYGETRTVRYRDELYSISILHITDTVQITCNSTGTATRNRVEARLSLTCSDTLYGQSQVAAENSYTIPAWLEACNTWIYREDCSDVYEVRDSILKWRHAPLFEENFSSQFGNTYLNRPDRRNLLISIAKANSMDKQVPQEQQKLILILSIYY